MLHCGTEKNESTGIHSNRSEKSVYLKLLYERFKSIYVSLKEPKRVSKERDLFQYTVNLWIFESGDWNFYSLSGYEIVNFQKVIYFNIFENLREKYFEIS